MSRSDFLAESPEFAALDEAERRAWLAAMGRLEMARLRWLRAFLYLLLLTFGCLVIVALGNFLFIGLEALRLGPAAIWVCMAAYVVLIGLLMLWIVASVQRALVHDSVAARLRSPAPRCAGCGYELSQVAELDSRPGVVRCPECGLVNPARR